ncbi:MAG: integration host factor subunit beta [Spirochaetota bacterium]|nr:integration host factor subunit beta [Spirochaetota bacterium]
MTRADIVNQISEEVNFPKKDIDTVITLLLKKVIQNIVKGETIYFRGFGTFGTKIRKERIARNLKTNEKLRVPEHRVPYFQPGKELKQIKQNSKLENARRR